MWRQDASGGKIVVPEWRRCRKLSLYLRGGTRWFSGTLPTDGKMKAMDRNDRRLGDMTLEELWSLFPIALVSYDSRWSIWAKEEMELLSAILADYRPMISHVGSTAIPAIEAKPIVDILVEVPVAAELSQIVPLMEVNGYVCMSASDNRVSFNKGYTSCGYADKVFHIHIHESGDNDEVIFRDYLIAHPETAKDYERLKRFLLPAYRNNRDGYTEAKTSFVRSVLDKAK